MRFLKCTKRVRDFLEIEVVSSINGDAPPRSLGNWYVHLFTADRKRNLIFMNETTLLSFIVFGAKRSNVHSLSLIFRRGLEQLLIMESVRPQRIDRAISEYVELQFANAESRKSLGNLNDLADRYKYNVLEAGGFDFVDVGRTIRDMNRMPQRNLDWRCSIEAAMEIINTV